MNPVEIEQAIFELASLPYDAIEFPYQFLEAFGNKETTIKRLKTGGTNKSDIDGGILQRKHIHMATCTVGTVKKTMAELRNSLQTINGRVVFILATDGETFEAENVKNDTIAPITCNYTDFPEHFGFFLSLAGISMVQQVHDSILDIKAASRLTRLYVELLKTNPEWGMANRNNDMNHFMARLIFCFFAEDTGIFVGDNLFTCSMDKMSASDSSDTHTVMAEIFRAMNTKIDERKSKNIKPFADCFPYVNGGLFSGDTQCPKFSRIAKSYLSNTGALDWKEINPDIFGSMAQAIAPKDEREEDGMHYTSVPSILKVLNPLFLDDLNKSLDDAGDNGPKLLKLKKRISCIRVFDPACGSGNFLVIAYKKLREIEYKVNKRCGEAYSKTSIPLTNFRGIELRGFAAEIARLALIIAEYQCDVIYQGPKNALANFLPLNNDNWITNGNALQVDWLNICPPTATKVKVTSGDLFDTPLDQAEIDFDNEGGETYICGNPPYLGTRNQTAEQKYDMKQALENYTPKYKKLDYVCAWIIKAMNYGLHTKTVSAFVVTNSICQGEQVSILWDLVFKNSYEIPFAHTSFKWKNLASNNAGVTVVIVAISNNIPTKKRLFSIEEDSKVLEKIVDNINGYLIASRNVIVGKESTSISALPKMSYGNLPGGCPDLMLTATEKETFLIEDPCAKRFIRKLTGSQEFIKGQERYCLWIPDNLLDEANKFEGIRNRIEAVRKSRLNANAQDLRALASKPHQFRDFNSAEHSTIILPIVSSEKREYITCGLLTPDVIVPNSAQAIYDAPMHNIALIASKLHRVWIGAVCGRMRGDLRYSNTLGWNTFPVPKLTEKNKADLTRCSEDILLAREQHYPATIANLYDPKNMPVNLRSAHDHNDEVVERIYIGRKFKNDTERIEKLFDMYSNYKSGKGI